MSVSMRVMSAGDGYRYLLRSVAAADSGRSLSSPLTRYYTEAGTPPGRWLGGGLAALGHGEITEGAEVSEAQLQMLMGAGLDPTTGDKLGRSYPSYTRLTNPGAGRADPREPDARAGASVAETATPAVREAQGNQRRAVAGYDFTFSLPKSASVLWGVADSATQGVITEAHHSAVNDVVAFMERHLSATRAGASSRDGAVAQVGVVGLIAVAFDHFDSRAGDPQLHTHVVVSNKVQTVFDGKWRSLDGRPLHAATVAISELHTTVFADYLTRRLGVTWEPRVRDADRNPAWTIRTVPENLVAEFSSRSRHIDVEKDRLITEYTATHGHAPSRETIIRLRQQATLMSRPEKELRSLAQLTRDWRLRAGRVLEADATQWARDAVGYDSPGASYAGEVPPNALGTVSRTVLSTVAEKRTTWGRWNLYAEAARQTMGWRFATAEAREKALAMITNAAEHASLRLTPPELATSPPDFRREDDTSVFRPRDSARYSSKALLDAEDRLLALSSDTAGPALPPRLVRRYLDRNRNGEHLVGDDQLAALHSIMTSGRVLDLLVGPAGAGKTTAMSLLRRGWEAHYGAGSVVGLAPSATAAHALAEDLGIATENLAKWWQIHIDQISSLRQGQLVIVDEASLAGTLSLDRLSAVAAQARAKVLLVGDWAQLQSVDAGGAFALLATSRDDVPELSEVHRFVNVWEKNASLDLRHGRLEAIDAYDGRGRLLGGDADRMADAAYAAWWRDRVAGLSSVLIAETGQAVTTLNQRARAELVLSGEVDGHAETSLSDGSFAAVGDVVITRRNDRTLRTGRHWVRNGDRWVIIRLADDGSVIVRRDGRSWASTVRLPREYVAAHVELGYAVTAYRAQGITTDTAHALIEPTTTRENLYVALTRGRRANTAYVAVDRPDDEHSAPHPGQSEATMRSVLRGVLSHVGAELSAHQSIVAEREAWGSIAQLAAEYETIAGAAQLERWTKLVGRSGLSRADADAVIESPAFGALCSELRNTESRGYDVARLLPDLVADRAFGDVQNVAAVLRDRVLRATADVGGAGRVRKPVPLVAGLVVPAVGPMAVDMRTALLERARLIETRAEALTDAAVRSSDSWLTELGVKPNGDERDRQWRRAARVVAAYRDRYGITDASALGPPAATLVQRRDAQRASAAIARARQVAGAMARDRSSALQSGASLGQRL